MWWYCHWKKDDTWAVWVDAYYSWISYQVDVPILIEVWMGYGNRKGQDKQRINDYWDEQLEMKNIIEYIE